MQMMYGKPILTIIIPFLRGYSLLARHIYCLLLTIYYLLATVYYLLSTNTIYYLLLLLILIPSTNFTILHLLDIQPLCKLKHQLVKTKCLSSKAEQMQVGVCGQGAERK